MTRTAIVLSATTLIFSIVGGSNPLVSSAEAAPAVAVMVPARPAPQAVVTEVAMPARAPGVLIAEGATNERTAWLSDTLELFRSNQLDLPDLDVHFYDDAAECRGHDGLFQPQFTPWRVLVCTELAYVLPHELSHAWEAAAMTDAERDEYVASQGLAGWDDPGLAWQDRAVENVAIVIQQNLTAKGPRTGETWTKRMEAYELLTGMPSPLRDA